MENNELTILERGIVSVSGLDANDFLQNIITNNINALASNNSKYSAILTPQGKFLYEFFVIKSKTKIVFAENMKYQSLARSNITLSAIPGLEGLNPTIEMIKKSKTFEFE